MKYLAVFFLFSVLALSGCGRDNTRLNTQEKQTVLKILAHWETWVPARQKDGTAPLLTFDELYKGLDAGQKNFLEKIRSRVPGGNAGADKSILQPIVGQTLIKDGKPVPVDVQYLPRWTYEAYVSMTAAMQREIGKKLLVESGYRSPAYQLYQFVFYLPKHGYSIRETNKWVALPGHSEHGNPEMQAIDFINQDGINGDNPGQTAETFEKLPEFQWLTKRAKDFGFELSYPRGLKDAAYEPWHWRFVRAKTPRS